MPDWTKSYFILIITAMVLGIFGCQTQSPSPAEQTTPVATAIITPEVVSTMQLFSPDFKSGQPIPSRYTIDGEDISPALQWSGVPAAAKSLALVCDDPDAPMGTWVHWIVVNLPKTVNGIPANGPLPASAVEIKNSFGKTTYGGPCPPRGTHRYFFRLYALDIDKMEGLQLKNYKTELEKHTLAQAELMGTYQRQ